MDSENFENKILDAMDEDSLLDLISVFEKKEQELINYAYVNFGIYVVLNIAGILVARATEWFPGRSFALITTVTCLVFILMLRHLTAEIHNFLSSARAALKRMETDLDEPFDLSPFGFGKGRVRPESRPLPEVDELAIRQKLIDEVSSNMAENFAAK